MGIRSWFVVAVAALAIEAAPAPQAPIDLPPLPPVAPNPTACAQISPATASLLAQNPSATPTVAASLAIQCLQSVPNKPQPAADLIKSLKAYAQWQSTLAWLKDPPASYMLPATDIQGEFDKIAAKAAAGGYASEYDFQLAIVELFSSAHDGHFAFRGDVFKAFSFRNNLAKDIVSVSKDGIEVPKLYHLAQLQGNGTAKAITKINGQDAATLITALTLKYSGYQDPDSQWNSQFRTAAFPTAQLLVAASRVFQGLSVTLTYEDGTTKSEDSFALVLPVANFTGVTNGETFYTKFCNPDLVTAAGEPADAASPTSSAATPGATESTSTASAFAAPTISGYPTPVVRDNGANVTAGYFLSGPGYEDVAVLVLSSFAPPSLSAGAVGYLVDYQNVIEKFLAQAKAQGKTRLIVDVTSNGGGFVVAGYELFAQLFPAVDPFQATNMRLADSVVGMARVANSIDINKVNRTNPAELEAVTELFQSSVVSNLVPGGVFSPEGQEYKSVDDILSPVSLKGDLFTAYLKTPLNMTDPQFNLTGTGSRSNPAPAVFKPENVVLLTDGTCGSTCTLFSYLMILQLNIKTTVIGGRPQTGEMQSIAGVEGAQVFYFNDITAAAAAVMTLSKADQKEDLRSGDIATLAEGYAIKRAQNPPQAGAVNGKNSFAATDATTPLQFLYQPANCRIFYTAEMITAPEAVWRRTVDATWTNPQKFCVQGSVIPVNTSKMSIDPLFRARANGTNRLGASGSAIGAPRNMYLAAIVAIASILAFSF